MIKKAWQYIKDWCWFYIWIRGNEFHPKLNLNYDKCLISYKKTQKEYQRITKQRDRAHQLDIKFNSKGN